ncbi:hypothetical protein EU527_02500 [Candidatus Thorarchaeota archaeon]|nr:MAG: hypothetical protein EU527_02500 [Candidatus Thorarchaeota archaeon]
MGKRLILGTKPEVDPLQEISESSLSVTTSTEIRWDDRKQGRALAWPLFVSLIYILIGLHNPLFLLIPSVFILLWQLFISDFREERERNRLSSSSFKEVSKTDTLCVSDEDNDSLSCKTPDGPRYLVDMKLCSAGSLLSGNISSLIRAIDDADGFCLIVTMRPEKFQRALDEERISNMIEEYLHTLPKGEFNAYILRRGGLWSSHVNIIGHVKDVESVPLFDSAIRASIPMEKWKKEKVKVFRRNLVQLNVDNQSEMFYAAGSELSEWLVQLQSELASEVGSNIPGQFLAPIRGRPNDYRLGVTLNPDTLQTGPPAGLSMEEFNKGVLLCGGNSGSRLHVIALLTLELLQTGKRVIVISNNDRSIGLTSLSEGSVYLELGRDLVLNPVDSEGIPRSEYIPLLISSLEAVAAIDLRGAADLESAIGRAVTLGNATLADVHIGNNHDEAMSGPIDVQKLPEQSPSKKSITGLEAIRSLYEGPAAKAFYGTSTVPTSRLVEPSLTIVKLALGSTSLEHFGWNLLCVKLAGLKPDPNLVIILDGAENFRVRNKRYMKHDSFTERVLKNLKRRGPILLALEHPVDMAPGAIGVLESCISLRIRESVDIKIVSDLLGLNVITAGMHTKMRISPRESSFLRIMDDNTALLVHDGTETCQPILLDSCPEMNFESDTLQHSNRLSSIIDIDSQSSDESDVSLLNRVTAGNSSLAIRVLKLLERYEPLTEEAVRRFIISSGSDNDPDVEAVLARLEHASMILRGHEVHNGVSYTNFRITMKGSMALRQVEGLEGGSE